MASLLAVAALAYLLPAVAATAARSYVIEDTYIGQGFTTGFFWQNIPDPTDGRVNYTDFNFAQSQGLVSWTSNSFTMRADSTTVLSASGPGRNAQRIVSNKQYTTSVTVLDVQHMPQGCGTWPAFWTTSDSVTWPNAGEIDILEGVNDESPNASTLHTVNGCTMNPSTMMQTGTVPGSNSNCYVGVNSNAGCQVQNNKPNNYGPAFNNNGGGWYVMERTSTMVNVWFWARNDPLVPAEIASGEGQINPAHYGTPYANFPNNNCNLGSVLGPNNIIINLTFCGSWAGSNYPSSCPSTCVNYVNTDPSAFGNAYWQINSLRVYQPGCATNTPTKRDLDSHRHHHQRKQDL